MRTGRHKYLVVTSWSDKGYEAYGKRFLASFAKHKQINMAVHAAHDEHLESQPEWLEWKAKYNKQPYIGEEGRPNMQAVRFAHKIFAITAPDLPEAHWRIWIDGDVEFTDKIDFSFLDDSKAVAYLGRPWYRYTECGFVAYHMTNPRAVKCLRKMRSIYTSGRLFELGENNWHDSYVFDYCRRNHVAASLWQDLTGHLNPADVEQGGTHVWPSSPLAVFSVHHKGPVRKRKAYGRTC